MRQPYFIRDEILMQYANSHKQIFENMVLPQILTNHLN